MEAVRCVDDEKEGNLRLQAVPDSTKFATNWGILVWKEWVTARSVKAADGRCSVSTPLLALSVDDFAYWLRSSFWKLEKRTAPTTHQKGRHGLPAKKSVQAYVLLVSETRGLMLIHDAVMLVARFSDFRHTEMKRLHKKELGTKPNNT